MFDFFHAQALAGDGCVQAAWFLHTYTSVASRLYRMIKLGLSNLHLALWTIGLMDRAIDQAS